MQTKVLLVIGPLIYIPYSIFLSWDALGIITQSSFGILNFLARLIGVYIGSFVTVGVLALLLSLIPYFIFREIAETYKRYFDYYAVVFIIISLVLMYVNISDRLSYY